jgi:uncharacterized DUF497 family protein
MTPDLARVEGFEWDGGNSTKSTDKHGVTSAEAEQPFFNQPLLLVFDQAHSASEARYHGLGRTDSGRLLHIAFSLRGDGRLIRVISARDMHRSERARYAQDA